MSPDFKTSWFSVAVLLLVLTASFLRAAPRSDRPASSAGNSIKGPEIFRQYCASCHGTDARGHGPASAALKRGAPDLTQIAKRNNGKFPAQHVRDIIEGKDTSAMAHGNREMPVWGPVFHFVEWDQDLGNVRLDAITKYLESIQEK
jgi:mono/diheme cytochrome c family protein